VSTAAQSGARLFVLMRDEDVSGTSGVGIVAEGVQFSNGQCALHWISQLECVGIYANIVVLERVHGHAGKTRIVWLHD
jgi:hypothetical protein